MPVHPRNSYSDDENDDCKCNDYKNDSDDDSSTGNGVSTRGMLTALCTEWCSVLYKSILLLSRN